MHRLQVGRHFVKRQHGPAGIQAAVDFLRIVGILQGKKMITLQSHVIRNQVEEAFRRSFAARQGPSFHRFHNRKDLLSVLEVIDVIESSRDFLIILKPFLAPFLHHFAHEVAPSRRYLMQLQNLDGKRAKNLRATNILGAITRKRKLTGNKMKQTRPQTVDIRPQIGLFLQNVLR